MKSEVICYRNLEVEKLEFNYDRAIPSWVVYYVLAIFLFVADVFAQNTFCGISSVKLARIS